VKKRASAERFAADKARVEQALQHAADRKARDVEMAERLAVEAALLAALRARGGSYRHFVEELEAKRMSVEQVVIALERSTTAVAHELRGNAATGAGGRAAQHAVSFTIQPSLARNRVACAVNFV